MPAPATVQIVTADPGGGDVRWAGRAGTVASVKYSFTLPGGADQLTFTVQADPMRRPPELAIGRRVTVHAGPRPCWDGTLDEPSAGEGGWSVTAHGAGTFGNQYQATWPSGSWDADRPAAIIADAISRGLRWVDHGDLSPLPDGAWLGQAPDNGSMTVADMLSLICSRGGLTWKIRAHARGNILVVIPIPVTVTRVLVATSPVARTFAGVVNAVCARYQSAGGETPAYGTVWATSAGLIARYGRTEKYLDLSDAGTDTGGANALAAAQAILARYQQAAWGGPLVVRPGE